MTLPSLRRNNQLPTFKWERPSVLGKMFTKKATRKHAERKDKRKHHVKHAIMPSVTGLKVGKLQFVSSSLSKANTAKWNADLF